MSTPRTVTQAKRVRLAFIKCLYSTANRLMKQPEPLLNAGLLTFHDAVELFLQLACEHLDVDIGKGIVHFPQYWDFVNPKLKAVLPQREAMRKLNSARNTLKHSGNFVSRHTLEDLASSVETFFEQATPLVFSLSFDSVSLIDLVTSESARKDLQDASTALQAGDLKCGFEACAVAFHELIGDYDQQTSDVFGRSPFFFGPSVEGLRTSHPGLRPDQNSAKLAASIGKLSDCANAFRAAISEMQGAMKILSLGLDYRKYTRFRLLTPSVRHSLSGRPEFSYDIHRRDVERTNEDLSFCVDFVVESALSLQAFVFSQTRPQWMRALADKPSG